MSHATEGDLHAYLDGALSAIEPGAVERLDAHLAHCADCRARLSQERAIRDRAGELLGAALPAVETPPFEATIGQAASRRRSWVSSERLAWAAAVVMALGAGWMGNALLRESPNSLMTPVSSALQDADSGPVGAEESVDQEQPGRAGEQVASGSASKLQAPQPAENAPADQLRARREATDDLRQETGAAGRVGDAPATPRAAAVDIQADARAASERFADEIIASGQRENEGLSSLLESTDAIDWQAMDEDGAAAWLGRSPLRIEDLEVLSYEAGDRAGARLVRVQQQLAGGETLTVIQESAAIGEDRAAGPARDRAVAPAQASEPSVSGETDDVRGDGASRTTTLARNLVDGVWVTLQAPLASDSLRALLSRIRQPPQ